MRLSEYFARVGFEGEARPDLETLNALCHAHLQSIPFEDLDVQLGTPIDLAPEAIWDKLVTRRRGGWCYEMNGLFAAVLRGIGFEVMRMAGGVMRVAAGDAQVGNHLCLLVRLDGRAYLADVGFGGSLAAPLPLEVGERDDPPYRVGLSRADGDYWRFTDQALGGPFSFDFRAQPADEALLAAKCAFLQTDPASMFVQNLVAQKREGAAHVSLRGRVLTRLEGGASQETLLGSADELVATLRDTFGMDLPQAASLWPKVCARHEAVFAAKDAAAG